MPKMSKGPVCQMTLYIPRPAHPCTDWQKRLEKTLSAAKIFTKKRRITNLIRLIGEFVLCAEGEAGTGKHHRTDEEILRSLNRETACEAWNSLCTRHNWSHKWSRVTRSRLCRALVALGLTEIAYGICPLLRPGSCISILTKSSANNKFLLHCCIPIRVRRTTTWYDIICEVAEELICTLKRVSKKTLQSVLCFYDSVLTHCLEEKGIPTCDHGDHSITWTALRNISSLDILASYNSMMTKRNYRVSIEHIQRHMRYLGILHTAILRGPGPKIPTNRLKQHFLICDDAAASECHSFETSADIKTVIAQIQGRWCHEAIGEDIPSHERVYSFSSEEVRRMVSCTNTTLERLVLMLFLTTGLRIGGICRLQWCKDNDGVNDNTDHQQPPRFLWTTEKNNHIQRVALTQTCRILLTHWYRETGRRRPQGSRSYIFPAKCQFTSDNMDSVGTGYISTICRNIFNRCGILHLPHAHPHTFRHTVIQMLFMNGVTWEGISKFVGHATPAVTSHTYGRLRHDDIAGLISNVPFIPNTNRNDASKWKKLASYLAAPFVFEVSDWDLLKRDASAMYTSHNEKSAFHAAMQDIKNRIDSLLEQ